MTKVKVSAFSVSLDGFGAGVHQTLENPIGVRGQELHNWMYPTKVFKRMIGAEGGNDGVDNTIAEKSFENVGAWIMGRNMFGPFRGPWEDDQWKGWWGDEPPFHAPVYVLTNHPRPSIEMQSGTTFHFIHDGIESALEQARKAAGNKDIKISGGVSTIRQFLTAGYIDEMQLTLSPIFLGNGEALFAGVDLNQLGFTKVKKIEGEGATHLMISKS